MQFVFSMYNRKVQEVIMYFWQFSLHSQCLTSIYVICISISEVLMVLSACFIDWLFEIGAGVCDMMTGCLIGFPGCLFMGLVCPGNGSHI